jgi:Asp-tRNA(Asn)/Glu-tRNA(Gln) amidotransferase A subunit family amidase
MTTTETPSATEQISRAFDTIAARNETIRAWAALDEEGARARAAVLDQHDAANKGLLYGVPIGVKDIIDVAGMPTRMGSPIYADAKPPMFDAVCVALARNAGAVVIGKTVTTELAGPQPSKTRNPVNTGHTPGGSSSGSAAAVAAGMVPLAFGTQTAGSIIRPAAYCGVVGFKPSFGLVPRAGVKLQAESLDTVGVLAKDVAWAARWYAVMTGSSSVVAPHVSQRPLRIGVITNGMERTETDMSVAIVEAASLFGIGGARVRDMQLPPIFDDVIELQRQVQLFEMARHYEVERTRFRPVLSEALEKMLAEGAAITPQAHRSTMQAVSRMRALADGIFAEQDVWLMPAATGAAPEGHVTTGDPLFNRMASLLHLPAISLPHFKTRAGLPIGIQLVATRQQDAKLLAVAARCAELLRGKALEDNEED